MKQKLPFFILALSLLFSQLTFAQYVSERSIDVVAGYGLSVPYDDVNVTGTGFYMQGEYVHPLTTWFELRPYIG
ncbi:MAG: hypothetical protein KJO53_15625, partial [Eudoraea sp.]|nr:hypothetical protein [Eudoraea sp.]